MKHAILLVILIFPIFCPAQNNPKLKITNNRAKSTYFKANYASVIDSAFIIASAVFNSQEFKSLFDTLSFPYWNHCIVGECIADKNYQGDERINEKTIFDSLFKETLVAMIVQLKKKSHAALGSTCPKSS